MSVGTMTCAVWDAWIIDYQYGVFIEGLGASEVSFAPVLAYASNNR